MKDFNAFLDMRTYRNWVHKISSWKYLSEDCPAIFPWTQSPSFLLSTLNSFQGVLKISFNPYRGRWQLPMARSKRICMTRSLSFASGWSEIIFCSWYRSISGSPSFADYFTPNPSDPQAGIPEEFIIMSFISKPENTIIHIEYSPADGRDREVGISWSLIALR